MLYSQLYRSIRFAYRGLLQQPRSALVASMPLLMCLPSAYANAVSDLANLNNVPNTSGAQDNLPEPYQPELNLAINGTDIQNPAPNGSNKAGLELTEPNTVDVESAPLNTDKLYSVQTSSAAFVNDQPINNLPINKTSGKKADLAGQVNSHGKSSTELATTFNTQSAKKSLDRLSQFYQTSNPAQTNHDPEIGSITTDNSHNFNDKESIDGGLSDNDWFNSTETTINATDSAPIAAPNVFKRKLNDASSYRCEGVWVTPSNLDGDSSYHQAVNRAVAQDGLNVNEGLPLYAQADYGYYDSVSRVELSGNVEVVQNGQLITADQLSLDLDSGVVGATGDVLLAETSAANAATEAAGATTSSVNRVNPTSSSSKVAGSGLITVADEIAYDTNSNAATATNVAFASIPMQAHGYAHKLNKPDDTHYQLDKVMFSTCPPTNRKWQLEAEQIDIDTETGRGESYNTTFRLGKVPVFYLPYFNFPIDDRRSTGLLTPSASIDSESGLKVSIPYYLNLAPNLDSTVTTDIYTNRNPMLTGELRYLLGKYGNGELRAGYLANDKQYDDKDREGLYFQHQWQSKDIKNLSASAVYNYVSDPQYITDFEDFGLTNNSLNLPRRGQVNYINDYLNGQLKVETFQSLKATDADGNVIQDKDKPYSRLPQLSIDYRLPTNRTNIEITGVHDSAYFKKSINDGSENEKSGLRIYNEIGASYPFESTWGYIVPKLSLQHLFTAYDEESRIVNNVSETDNTQTAFAPKVSIDSGLNFYQSGTPFGLFDHNLGGYQLLSPRLKYTYSKFRDHSKIPNFNTRVASVDYDQLFSDSRFLGYDRIADNNNISVGLNYRYIDAMGVTRFDGSIGDQFYLDEPQVALDNATTLSDQSSSGVAWNSSVQPYRNIWFDFNGALNDKNRLNFINSQIRYQPTPLSLINLGLVKRKQDPNTNQDALSAITASALFPINNNWRVMAQGQFDNRSHKFIDSTVGLNYEDCCYGFSIYGRSYYNDLNLDLEPTRAVMAEFRINGLGESRSRLSKLFIDRVPGFEPVDTLWNK